jgi:hypothetical protein
MSTPTGPYEGVNVLPVGDDNFPTYRVKRKAEPCARAAPGKSLVAVGFPPSQQTDASLSPDPAFVGRLSRPFLSR